MKTVGEVMREVDYIQDSIQNLHILKQSLKRANEDDEKMNGWCEDAIVLLARYRHVLSALPIKEVKI